MTIELSPGPAFPAGGGEMGALMRRLDWAATPLGPPAAWPQTLRTCLRLMLNTRHPMMVLWGGELLQFYNDSYSESLGPESHPAMFAQPCRAWWPDVWHLIGPQLGQVLAGHGATWNAEHLVPVLRNGRREDTWWTYSYSPIDDDSAPQGVGGVLVVCQDVTKAVLARAQLRDAEARWRGVFDRLHEGFVLCEMVAGPDGRAADFRFLELNPAFERLTGLDPARLVGRLAGETLPGLEPHWLETYARVAETGEPAHRVLPATSLGRWFEVIAYRTEPGRFAALFLDVTARRASEERQALLAREVDHRSKNLLAVVQAAVALTRADRLDEYRTALAGRIAALARTQTQLAAAKWDGVDLRQLVQGELDAVIVEEQRVSITGDPVLLRATVAQPLAMALHELASNAARHGALSVPSGRVSVTWHREATPRLLLALTWQEHGGPNPGGRPSRRGFGTRVLEATIGQQLGGQVALRWEAEGLGCEIRTPL